MPYIKDTDGEDCSLEPIAICGMGRHSNRKCEDLPAKLDQLADFLERLTPLRRCGSY